MTYFDRVLRNAKLELEARTKPWRDLIEVAEGAAQRERDNTKAYERLLEQMRPVWAQGFTSDSEAAQASSNALAEIWAILEVTNQTEAMARLRVLTTESD